MTADVYGNMIYHNNAKGNNTDTLFHLGLLSFQLQTVFFTSWSCLLFCVSKHCWKASSLSTQVLKFKSIKQFYGLQKVLRGSKQHWNSSVVRGLKELANIKLSPLSLKVPNLKHCCWLSLETDHWTTQIPSKPFHMIVSINFKRKGNTPK